MYGTLGPVLHGERAGSRAESAVLNWMCLVFIFVFLFSVLIGWFGFGLPLLDDIDFEIMESIDKGLVNAGKQSRKGLLAVVCFGQLPFRNGGCCQAGLLFAAVSEIKVIGGIS